MFYDKIVKKGKKRIVVLTENLCSTTCPGLGWFRKCDRYDAQLSITECNCIYRCDECKKEWKVFE